MFGQILEPIVRSYFIEENDPNFPDMPGGWRCTVHMTKPKNPGFMKEERIIQALEPLFTTHRVVIDEESIRSEKLQRQITRICRQRNCLKHEDEIESFANCCQLFEDRLSVTQDIGIKRKQEEAYMRELQSFGDYSIDDPSWISR
jgi:hypothetical protein